MPEIHSRDITLALDMRGCPNRCRHCYLGRHPNRQMTEDDLRWAAAQFRSYRRPGEHEAFFQRLTVMSWAREPDFSPDYRRLYDLEAELSDGEPHRFELLSVWRLARDASYAPWAKSVGTTACQLSFFGVGSTQDWFYRRRGAYQDCLLATERLLDAGIAPRWQIFLTRRLLPDLDDLLRLVDTLRLRERVAALGNEFQIFMHTPSPDGEARRLESLRPTDAEVASLPDWLLGASRRRLSRNPLWRTEAELWAEVMAAPEAQVQPYSLPRGLAFYVLGNWDVYSNLATWERWWRLGNLRGDGIGKIIRRFEANDCLGLHALYTLPARELALRYGDPQGRRLYTDANDLLALYLACHCEDELARHTDRDDRSRIKGGLV